MQQPENRASGNTNDNPSFRDLDLLELLRNVSSFFRRNFSAYLIIGVLGLAAGVGYYLYKPKVYQSSLSAISHSIEDTRVLELIGDLNQLIEDNDNQLLGQKLNLTAEEAAQITDFEVKSNYESEKKAKKLNDDKMELIPSRQFNLTIGIKDLSLLPKVQEGIIYYFENNPFNKAVLEAHRKEIANNIKAYQFEIRRIDSLNNLFFAASLDPKKPLMLTSSVGQSNLDIAVMQEKINQYQYQLELMHELRIVRPFTEFKKHRSPKLLISVGVAELLALIFGTIFLLIRPKKS